jgi:hypothetical protein
MLVYAPHCHQLCCFMSDMAETSEDNGHRRATHIYMSCVQDIWKRRRTFYNRAFHKFCYCYDVTNVKACKPLDYARSGDALPAFRVGTQGLNYIKICQVIIHIICMACTLSIIKDLLKFHIFNIIYVLWIRLHMHIFCMRICTKLCRKEIAGDEGVELF